MAYKWHVPYELQVTLQLFNVSFSSTAISRGTTSFAALSKIPYGMDGRHMLESDVIQC